MLTYLLIFNIVVAAGSLVQAHWHYKQKEYSRVDNHLGIFSLAIFTALLIMGYFVSQFLVA